MAKLNVFTLENLNVYDELIKEHIAAEDAKALKTVAISGNTLKFYTVSEPVGETAPAFEITLPEQDLTDFVTKAQIGTIAEGKTVVQMIEDAKSESTYDDTTLKTRIAKNETDIATLNGDETTAGSVKKQVADAVAKIVADAPEAYDTLKEISDWISSHSSDAATMNSQITTNKNDITALKTLVGELPKEATSTTVIAYIKEVVDGLSIGDYAKASDLTAAIARISANETAIAGLGALAQKDTVEKTDLATGVQASLDKADSALQESDVSALRTSVANNTTAISALEGKVGDGYEAIPEATIRALFA